MSPVKNALTDAEWRLLALWKAGKMPGGKVRGMVVLGLPGDHVHAAAACALYGEPFGFTQEDLAMLHELRYEQRGVRAVTAAMRGGLDEIDARIEWLGSLASRIAALIPIEP